MTIRASVVIPHYQDLASLDACLAALVAQTVPRDDYEIVVADNDSPVGAAAVEQAIAGRARLTIVTEKGAGSARNGGVAASAGKVLAFTGCDSVPAPGWLAAGITALEQAPVIGGRMTVSTSARKSGAEAFESVFAFDNEDYVTRKGFMVTANLFRARATFDTIDRFASAYPKTPSGAGARGILAIRSPTPPMRSAAIRHGRTGRHWSRNGRGSARKAMPWRSRAVVVGPGSPSN